MIRPRCRRVAESTDEDPEEEEAVLLTTEEPTNLKQSRLRTLPEQPTIAGAGATETATISSSAIAQIPDFTINVRPGPSVSSGDPIGSLDPSTPLMFLDEEALDEEGVVWLKFRTESGQEGWIREVDTQAVIQ